MGDPRAFERSALEAESLAAELAALKKDNVSLRDEIDRLAFVQLPCHTSVTANRLTFPCRTEREIKEKTASLMQV